MTSTVTLFTTEQIPGVGTVQVATVITSPDLESRFLNDLQNIENVMQFADLGAPASPGDANRVISHFQDILNLAVSGLPIDSNNPAGPRAYLTDQMITVLSDLTQSLNQQGLYISTTTNNILNGSNNFVSGQDVNFKNWISAMRQPTSPSDGTLRMFTITAGLINGSGAASPEISTQFSDVAAFRASYMTAFPNATEAQFDTFFRIFVNQYAGSPLGYSVPSDVLQEFKNTLQELVHITAPTLAQGTHSEKIRVVTNVFALLVSLIDVLQKVATVQSQGLNYLTSMDKAYTANISKIPTFVRGGNSGFGGTSSDDAEQRGNLNAFNQSLADNQRSFRDLVENQSKNLQSSVSQTNEAVNQQAQLGTSILQEFSTILSSLFR